MKFVTFIVFLVLLNISCDSSQNETSSVSKIVIEKDTITEVNEINEELYDSLPQRISIDIEALLSKTNGDTVYQVPFNLDESFLEGIGSQESTLTNAEVQYLSFDLVKNITTESSAHTINTFIEMDSMEIKGTMDEYLEGIDLGMAEYFSAGSLQKISINDNIFILMWFASYSTVEACPYYSVTSVFGTLFIDNTALNTLCLGESSGGGDAPYWSDTFITSEITDSTIHSVLVRESGEEDPETGEELVDRSEESSKIKITMEGFELIVKNKAD